MSLYKYSKKNIKTSDERVIRISQDRKFMTINPSENEQNNVTIWSLMSRLGFFIRSSTLASILFPALLVIIGISFIYREFFPEIQQIIQEKTGYYTLGNLSPVDDQYINIEEYISRPTNLSKLTEEALNLHILEPDTVSSKFNGTFYISIPSLNIDKIPVQANVDSTTEESYMKVLNYSLAHFQGTGLPISNVGNNIVIYGHSASPSYNPKPSDPMVAFSFLPELKVGDEIIIDIEGKTYKYKMYKSKIVEPDDTSIITGSLGKTTLTLFTCFPLGSDAKRYIAIARPLSQ